MPTEEEIQRFVSENKALIEKLMQLQKDGAVEAVSAGREIAHDAAGIARDTADAARARTEDFFRAAYGMFMDPEVQRHFMAMGMEFVMGVTTMMQKAPMPDVFKDAAQSTERNFRDTACRTNENCRRSTMQKVEVNTDDGPSEIRIDTDE